MFKGRVPATHSAVYTANCTERGCQICRDGVLIKTYRLAAICYQLNAHQRRRVSTEFAQYDIRNEAFMLA